MAVRRVVANLTVDAIAPERERYIDTLGLREVMDLGWIVTLADDSGAQLSLITRDATAPCNPVISVEVDDVDAAYAAARAGGARIVHELTDEAWGVRRFFFADGAGNVINVLAHR